MILSSSRNMQVSGIAEAEDGKLYFRAFADSDAGIAITNTTYIIETYKDESNILRVIDEEIASISVIEVNTLVAVSKFGNVYVFDGMQWDDYKIKFEPVDCIFKSLSHKNKVYSVCTGGMFECYEKGQWEEIASDVGDDDLDLIGLCFEHDDSFFVCGESGILASVSKNKDARIIDIPTNGYLLEVKKISDSQFAVCGRQGALFIGFDDEWHDYSEPEYDANFTSMDFWENKLYLSAGNQVLLFENKKFAKHWEVPSLNLFGLKNNLWSIGLNTLYKYDGIAWHEVVLEIEI